jgi:ADP-heptose:LPS heptosyltransferase
MGQLKKRVEKPVRRVLICRTDNIGDVVLTLPLAGCLRERIPEVSVDFLCRAYAAPMRKNAAMSGAFSSWKHILRWLNSFSIMTPSFSRFLTVD